MFSHIFNSSLSQVQLCILFQLVECVLIFHMYRYYATIIFTFVDTPHGILYTFSSFDSCLILHVYCYNSVRNGVV